MFFASPEDVRWNPDRDAVEFSVILDPYEGTVTVSRRVFQRLLDQSPTPKRCIEAFHLQRTRFELVVERKLRRRQLTDDGNVEITGRELREKTSPSRPEQAVRYSHGVIETSVRPLVCRKMSRSAEIRIHLGLESARSGV
jgi:hypothetical protein